MLRAPHKGKINSIESCLGFKDWKYIKYVLRPSRLDSLFLNHQILCLDVGGWSFFIIHYRKRFTKIAKQARIGVSMRNFKIMKVEEVILKPMHGQG